MTPAQRLTLLMMCDLHRCLGVESEFDPVFIQEALADGHDWALEWRYPILGEEPVGDADALEVAEILTVWCAIKYGLARLDARTRETLDEHAAAPGWPLPLEGFDGNGEVRHMTVAALLVERLNRFEEFANRPFDSHRPDLKAARRMTRAFRALGPMSPLSAEQIGGILAARA